MNTEEYDYKAISEQLQRENEQLRIKVAQMGHFSFSAYTVPDISLSSIMEFVEKHYLFCIVVSYVLMTVISAVVDLGGKHYGRR